MKGLKADLKIQQYVSKSLIFAIGTSYDAIWRDFSKRLRKENCGFLHAVILISLVFEEDRGQAVTPSQLAQTFKTSRGNISHCISYLEKKQFLRRALDPQDARSYRLTLTPPGRRTAMRLVKVIDDLEGFFESKFGASEILSAVALISGFERAYRERLAGSS